MFKSIFSITALTLLLQANTFASTINGLQLLPATNASLLEASVEIDENSITAWETVLESQEEVVVKIINTDAIQLGYGCHLHGDSLACHEEHHGHGDNRQVKDPSVTLDFIKKAHLVALNKFEKAMVRNGADLSVATSYKVWTHKDDHSDGHGAGTDVWTKINYSLNGQAKEIFVLCHVHGSELDFACHYSKEGEGEPTLDFGDDDHDHDH